MSDILNNLTSSNQILFVAPVRFDGLFQRHQGIATELRKKGYRVFYMNPLRAGGFSVDIEQNSGLDVATVKLPFKASRYPAVQKYAVWLALKLTIKKLHINVQDTVLWLAEPSCAEIVNWDWMKIIYDCCDLHGAFPGQKASVWQDYELKIAEKANKIFVSHPFLKQKFASEADKCFLLPNATSYKTQKQSLQIKPDEKIKLLSSGAHFEWVDINWLKMLSELDGVELHIAGVGRGNAYEQLIKKDNVIVHGKLSQQELMDLIRNCQIGLVPFKDIELIKAVDPIKVYDYAAMGLQIWAPDIESLHGNQYISCFIADKLQAETAIQKLRTENRKLNGNVPTWADRVNEI